MQPFPLRTLASLAGLATVAFMLFAGGCSTDSRSNDGPLGETRGGITLATPGFVETTVIQGLKQPTVVRFASDGRVFVAEKGGKIWVYDSLSDATPTLFVNLADRVHDFWDRGLLGMALDPAFPNKPDVYVLYAYDGDPGGPAPKWGDACPTPPGATANGCVISGRLSRFTATGNVAGPETVLVEGWRQQFPSHSIGSVEFGPDGALYASGGDGASFNFVDYGQVGNPLADPPVAEGAAQTPPSAEGGALRSQSPRRTDGPTLLNGSVIRVDPATGLGLPDNPLAASSDVNAQRIIAYGLRNPFRMATRPGKKELWLGDVGWDAWEEVNRIPLGGAKALNFGWPCYEGVGKQAGYDGADLALCETLYSAGDSTAPYFSYAHNAGVSATDGCGRGSSSVTGIAFYTGNSYPSDYQGALFFADYSRRCIYVMTPDANGEPKPATARSFHVDADAPVFLTTGPGGDLFYAAINAGTIQRISYLQPAAAFTATPSQGQAPLIVSFDGTKSVKALPTDVLTYAWDLDGDGEFDDATEPKPAYLYDAIGSYAARLKVTDQRGITGVSQPLTIKVTADPPPVSTPPRVFIDTPVAGTTWKVGDKIEFSGHATDAEDGALPASALSWQVVIQHCPSGCHIHDLMSFDGVASGSVTAEDHDYPMHLELILTATDSSGESRSARLELDPKTVSLLFDTVPSGLSLVVGATAQTTPFVRRVIVGSANSVSAATTQTVGSSSWDFASWSDGKPASHSLPPATVATRYVATYSPGGGLTAQYFDQLGFAGTPLTRVDPVVNFNWGTGSPDASIGPDTFSVRWSGELKADFAETYTFSTTSDDGVRLSIDGSTLIDNFTDHSPTLNTGSLSLTPGWHSVVLEYYEKTGGAQVNLSWSSPSQPEQIIPQSHLRPGCAGSACSSGQTCNADQLCVPQCDPNACKGASHCRLSDEACIPLCTGVVCPVGDTCKAGLCVDACSLISCASGTHCELGKCIADPPPETGGAGGQSGAGGDNGAGAANGGAAGAATGEAGSPTLPGDGGATSITPAGGAAGATASEGLAGDGAAVGNAGQPTLETGGSSGSNGTGEAGLPNATGGQVSSGGSGGSSPGGSGSGASGGSGSGCSCGVVGEQRPSAWALLGAGLGLALVRRRRRR